MSQPLVIAYHLIWTAYGWWLPNDPRGSGSQTIRNDTTDGRYILDIVRIRRTRGRYVRRAVSGVTALSRKRRSELQERRPTAVFS